MERRHDDVIVGGGSARCVPAGRLSHDPGISVLLLEAGPKDNTMEVGIPAAFPTLFKSERDWNYATVPQPPLGGRELYWPRGYSRSTGVTFASERGGRSPVPGGAVRW